MNPSTHYHHGNLKQKLVAAAFELLDTQGINGVGIRQVARKVNAAHSAPANHFKNKAALYTELAKESFIGLACAIRDKQRDGPTTQSVHDFCKSVLDFALAFPNRYRLMWRKDCFDNSAPDLNEAKEEVYRILVGLLEASAEAKKVDVESQAIAVWSLIHGYVSLRLDGNLEQGTDVVTAQARSSAIIDVLLDGLL